MARAIFVKGWQQMQRKPMERFEPGAADREAHNLGLPMDLNMLDNAGGYNHGCWQCNSPKKPGTFFSSSRQKFVAQSEVIGFSRSPQSLFNHSFV